MAISETRLEMYENAGLSVLHIELPNPVNMETQELDDEVADLVLRIKNFVEDVIMEATREVADENNAFTGIEIVGHNGRTRISVCSRNKESLTGLGAEIFSRMGRSKLTDQEKSYILNNLSIN